MYLSKLQNLFVQIAKRIGPIGKMYLSKLQNLFVQIAKCIGPIGKMSVMCHVCNMSCVWETYEFGRIENVFVQIKRVFVQIAKLQNVCHVCRRHRSLVYARAAVEHPMIVPSVRATTKNVLEPFRGKRPEAPLMLNTPEVPLM